MRIKKLLWGLASLAALAIATAASAADNAANGSPTVSPGFACPAGYQWSVNTPIPSCVPSVGGTASPIPCNGGTVSWTGAPGVTCQASVGAALDGIVKTVSSTNTSTGNANFTCTNGTWTKTGASSCTAAPCAAGTLSWTANGYSCSGPALSTSAGATASVTASGATMGAASFTCSVTGTWGTANAGATCAPANCPGGTTPTWSPGGFAIGGGASVSCSGGALPLGTPGQSLTLSDNIAPTTGSASFTCANGTWVMGAKSCVENVGCPYQSMAYWQHGGPVFGGGPSATCVAGPLPDGTQGQQVQLTDSQGADGATGSARFTCNNGSWQSDSSRTCGGSTPPSTGCAAANLGWYVGSNYCSATASATSNGGYAFLSDSTAPLTGSAYATCNGGTWGTPYNTTCSAAPSGCPAGGFSWNAGGETCNASTAAASPGQTVTLTDTTAPTTGSAYVQCTAGGWGAPYSGTCSTAAPSSCPPGTFNWTTNGSDYCSASVGGAVSGQSVSLSDTTAPTTGAAYVACNAGNWGTPYSTTCVKATEAPSGCAAGDGVVYGVGNGGIRYLMKAASSGFSTTISMMPPYVWYQPSQIGGAGALYAPGGDGYAPPVYCSGQATATCSGSTWSITPNRTPGLTPQCSSSGGF